MKCTSVARKSHFLRVSILLLIVCSTTRLSLAEAIPLSDLLGGGSLISGDKEFSEFTYAATGDMPSADRVNVIPHQDADLNYGLRFQGAFLDLPENGASDALITYKVRVTDPEWIIKGAHLSANIVAPAGGSGTITESFLPIFNMTDEVLRVPTSDGLNTDWILFPEPASEFTVQKNILFSAGEDGQVDMSFVDQTFEQMPEPAAIPMVLLGFVLASVRLRRRRNDVA